MAGTEDWRAFRASKVEAALMGGLDGSTALLRALAALQEDIATAAHGATGPAARQAEQRKAGGGVFCCGCLNCVVAKCHILH